LSICCSVTLITIDVQLLLFQFTGCFYIRTLVSHFHHLFHLFGREPLGLVELGFYRTDGFPTTSVKALKRIQSNNSNQWPKLTLSSSTTGRILTEVMLLFYTALWL